MDVVPGEVGAEEFEDLKVHPLEGPGLVDPHYARNVVLLNLHI